MSYPTVSVVFDRRKKANNRTPGFIEIRVGYQYTRKYISTGLKVLPKNWKNGRVTGVMEAKTMNQRIETMLNKVNDSVTALIEDGCFTMEKLTDMVSIDEKSEKNNFLNYAHKRATIRTYGKSLDSIARYERFLKWLENWGQIVTFSDITDENIIKLDETLKCKNFKPYSIWNNYHRFLNSFILDAINDGLVKRNPYKWINIDKDKNSKALEKHLTREELTRIETVPMPTESLEKVRDLFVFQTYTCMSYVDMKNFKWEEVQQVDGNYVYSALRGKTKQRFTFMLLQPALAILRKYHYKLPIISNMKYNDYIKMVAAYANIKKPVSSHWARHTGATLLLNDGGISMEVVAKILGHSSPTMTRKIYAKLLDETIVKEMSKASGDIVRRK